MRIPIAPPGERDIDSLFGLIAAATYDWESWLGPDGRPLWVNDAVIRITGYTPGECLDMADYPASLFLPADLPRFLQAREDMRAGHPGNDLQLRLAKRDGSIAWVSLSWQAITATDGQPLGTRLSVRNLSLGRSDDPHHQLRRAASRLMHEAMREQRTLPEIYAMVTEHAARTLDVSRVGLWLFDDAHDQLSCANLFSLDSGQHSNGTYLHCADYPAYVAAISSDELLAVHQADTHPALRELLDEYLRPLGVSALLDAPIVRDGRTVGVLCHEHIGPPRQWSPAEATFAETLADFIALAQTSAERQQLRVQTERLASIIENSPYMVTTVLPDGHISYLNSAGRRFLGLPGEGDLLHEQAQSFYSPEQLRFRQEVAVPAALAAGHWSGESALEIPGQGRVPI